MESFKTLLLGTPPTRTYTASATGLLTSANNLSDVADAATSRTNLGLGTTTTAFNSITAAAATNLTLAGGSSGASLVLGQGASGKGVFTGPSATGMVVDLVRTTGTAVANTTFAQINSYNGSANRAVIIDFTSAGATDSGHIDFWTKATTASIAQVARLTAGGNLLIGGTTDISGSGGVYAANGLEVPNNIAVRLRNSSGTAINTLKMDTSNNLEVVAAGGGDIELFANGGTLGSNAVKVMNTTASTSTTTGALQVAGGVGIAGAAFVGGNLTVSGSSVVVGASSPSANSPYRALVTANSTVAGDITNTDAGTGANASWHLVTDAGTNVLRAHSIAHSTWPGKLLLSSPAAGSGVVINTGGPGDPIEFYTNNNLRTTISDTGVTHTGPISTSAPTGGAGAWELGVANAVTPTSPNRTITIEIGGTVYYLHAKTTND